jgi:hypothetical protein
VEIELQRKRVDVDKATREFSHALNLSPAANNENIFHIFHFLQFVGTYFSYAGPRTFETHVFYSFTLNIFATEDELNRGRMHVSYGDQKQTGYFFVTGSTFKGKVCPWTVQVSEFFAARLRFFQ